MEKIDYEHGKFKILTTEIGEFDYADYVEWCKDNDIEPEGKNSQGFWEWCRDKTDSNYECDLYNISNTGEYDTEVEITGELGLWDGIHEIVPVVCNNVKEAILKCGGSCDEIDVDWNDGVIVVYARHHDGTNCFTIRKKDGERLPYLYAI